MPLMFKPSKRPGWIVASESVLESSVNRYREPQASKKLVVGSLNILRESVPVKALAATGRLLTTGRLPGNDLQNDGFGQLRPWHISASVFNNASLISFQTYSLVGPFYRGQCSGRARFKALKDINIDMLEAAYDMGLQLRMKKAS
jgi:hypothetical protein